MKFKVDRGDFTLPVDYTKLTWQERRKVREQYIEVQEGKCSHCQRLLSKSPSYEVMKLSVKKSLFPKGFFDHPVHLHHSHKSGMTIGAVHNYCNAVLWQYHGE